MSIFDAFKKVYVIPVIVLVFVLSFFVLPQKSQALSWEQAGVDGLGQGATATTIVSIIEFNGLLYTSIGDLAGVKVLRSSDGVSWTQVNTSGFDLGALNIDATLYVFNSALYAATDALGPAQVWKTTNGTDWTQIGPNGFGDPSNIGFNGMTMFDNHLYFGTVNLDTGGEVFRLDNESDLTQVNDDGFGSALTSQVWYMNSFNGSMYAGTFNDTTGAQIWRTANGTTWEQVVAAGFNDANNTRINTLFVFGGRLYAGTLNTTTGTELWRSIDGTQWEQVNTDGFGKATDTWTGDSVVIVNGTVYLGTRSDTGGGNSDGARLFTSTDGTTWTQEGQAGFGDINNFAIYAINFNGRIHIGFSNGITGAEIWRTGTIGSLAIANSVMSEGTVGQAYSVTINVANGTLPIVWSLVSGSLPQGLTMDYSTGTVSGTPTESGTFVFTVGVRDSGIPVQIASQEMTLKINPAPPPTLPETGGASVLPSWLY